MQRLQQFVGERERWRDQLEDGTPVVLVSPELPVAFLVGRPDGVLLDSVFSRLRR